VLNRIEESPSFMATGIRVSYIRVLTWGIVLVTGSARIKYIQPITLYFLVLLTISQGFSGFFTLKPCKSVLFQKSCPSTN